MEDQHPKIEIGKDIIESLTLSMYEDCRFIYREYIQNAADAIDKAIQKTWLEKGKEEIHVHIDNDKRQISISDNGTGIEKIGLWKCCATLLNLLRDVAKIKVFVALAVLEVWGIVIN